MKSLRRIGSATPRARAARSSSEPPNLSLLGQDRERRGAAALVGGDHVRERELLADHPGRRRARACARRSRDRPGAPARRRTAPGSSAAGAAAARSDACLAGVGARRRASVGARARRRSASSAFTARAPPPARWWRRRTLQRGGGRAGVDRLLRRAATPSASESAPPAGVDRRARVEHGQVARRPGLAGEDRAARCRRSAAGSPPGTASAGAARQPDLLGRDRVAREPSPRHLDHLRRAEMLSSSRPSSLETSSAWSVPSRPARPAIVSR